MLFPNVSENCPLPGSVRRKIADFALFTKQTSVCFCGKNKRPARLTGRWKEDYGAASTATMRPSP